MGGWVITKIVFFEEAKNEIFEKSPNGCQHGTELVSEGKKSTKEKMLSSVPCANSFQKICETIRE